MKSLKMRMIEKLTLLLGGFTLLFWVLFYALFASHYFLLFPIIPVFFYLMGIVVLVVLDRCKTKNPRQLLNVYMLLRVCKIALCVLFVLLYVYGIDSANRSFGITFALYYIGYLGIETYLFSQVERHLKNDAK